jgi:hypothetical protein
MIVAVGPAVPPDCVDVGFQAGFGHHLITMGVKGSPTTWTEEELAAGRTAYPQDGSYQLEFSSYNPTPGIYICHKTLLASSSYILLRLCGL